MSYVSDNLKSAGVSNPYPKGKMFLNKLYVPNGSKEGTPDDILPTLLEVKGCGRILALFPYSGYASNGGSSDKRAVMNLYIDNEIYMKRSIYGFFCGISGSSSYTRYIHPMYLINYLIREGNTGYPHFYVPAHSDTGYEYNWFSMNGYVMFGCPPIDLSARLRTYGGYNSSSYSLCITNDTGLLFDGGFSITGSVYTKITSSESTMIVVLYELFE